MPEFDNKLSVCEADALELATALPQGTQFSAILTIDPLTLPLIPAKHLRSLLAQQRSRLSPEGCLVMLVLSVPRQHAQAAAVLGGFLSAHVASCATLPLMGKVEEAAAAAGLERAWDWPSQHVDVAAHYAATLRVWRGRLRASWRAARLQGVSDNALRRYAPVLAPCLPYQNCRLL